ncbi:MAG: hypothetical protein QOF76_2161 [Solirubrobacteraceae bacterium]|jgi:hypothetical protein|nr:hypothetical protein [Solirubrobacteraceae bacterium]
MEYLIICSVSGVWAAAIARSKGSNVFVWFGIGAIVPILGPIMAMMYRYETDEVRRQCPTCGKIVPLHDALCTRCGTELEFPDVMIQPLTSDK